MNAKSENENFNQKKGRKETTINSRKSIEIKSISHGWQRYIRRWGFQKTSSDEFETNEFNTQTIRTLYIKISNHSITETINVKKICEVNQIEWKHFSDSVNYQYTQFNPIHWEKNRKNSSYREKAVQNFPNEVFICKLSFLLFTHLPHEKHSQRTHSTNETKAFQNEPKKIKWIWIDITYLPLHSLAAHFSFRNRFECPWIRR